MMDGLTAIMKKFSSSFNDPFIFRDYNETPEWAETVGARGAYDTMLETNGSGTAHKEDAL